MPYKILFCSKRLHFKSTLRFIKKLKGRKFGTPPKLISSSSSSTGAWTSSPSTFCSFLVNVLWTTHPPPIFKISKNVQNSNRYRNKYQCIYWYTGRHLDIIQVMGGAKCIKVTSTLGVFPRCWLSWELQ